MNCDHICEKLTAFLDGALTPSEAADVSAHLRVCTACHDEKLVLSKTWDMLAVLEPIEPSPDFRVRFWERVRQEEERKRSWLWWPRLVPTLAGALGLWVVGVGLGSSLFMRYHAPMVPSPALHASATDLAPAPDLTAAFMTRLPGNQK